MIDVFADTSYWIAFMHPADTYHKKARGIVPSGRMVTTTAVVLEVIDAFSQPKLRPLALRFWDLTKGDSDLVVVPLNPPLLKKAVDLFAGRMDKAWSLTDCFSFVVMEERDITDALTTDRHFEQAGYQALLRGG